MEAKMERYEKQQQLGKGSFGVVFLVKDKISSELKVLKQVNTANLSEKLSQNARDEVALLAQLDHANIVKYFDSFHPNGAYLYLVTEYCDGGDLNMKIKRQRGVFIHEKLIQTWLFQLTSAISFIHEHKILHRDIKAANVFLSKDEKTVKLGDFGVAKLLRHKYEMANTCIGTPYYLSPEICAKREYNSKSDIWSLGCLAYELLTLKCPFTGKNMKELFNSISKLQYLPMPTRYSYELRNLVSQMLRRNPEERPSAEKILARPFFCSDKQAKVRKITKLTKKSTKSIPRDKLGSLAVYAVPLNKRKPNPRKLSVSSNCSSIESDSVVSSTEKSRKKWGIPSGTLISVLSSFNLKESTSERENYTLRKTVSFDSAFSDCRTFEHQESKENDEEESELPFAETVEATCVFPLTNEVENHGISLFCQLETWRVLLENLVGINILREVLRLLRDVDMEPEDKPNINNECINFAEMVQTNFPLIGSHAIQIVQFYFADKTLFGIA